MKATQTSLKSTIIQKLSRPEVQEYLKKHQMKYIWLAGSVARDEAGSDSDVDIVYEYDEKLPMTGWGIVDAKLYMESMLNRSVDILDKEIINHRIKDFIFHDMQSIF